MKPDFLWRAKMAWSRSAFGHPMGQAILIILGIVVVVIAVPVGGLVYLLAR